MTLLSQTWFPRLWLLMQKTIGGNACKQRLAMQYYGGQKRVLEIGCSVGNISSTFCVFPNITFTGIDIDANAINLAKKRFHHYPNFTFSLSSLEELSQRGDTFDYVLFAGILHHVDDNTGLKLLQDAVKCTADDGVIVIYEPEALKESDGWIFRFFYGHFEQGAFLRSRDELKNLIERGGIMIKSIEDSMVSPGIVQRPYVARFNLIVGTPNKQ